MNPIEKKFAAAILAGGNSTRFCGVHKGLLEIQPGVPIITNLIEEINSSGIEKVVIVANNPEPYSSFGLTVLPDLRHGAGPIAGVEAGLSHYKGQFQGVLFVPCDLPAMTSWVLLELLHAFVNNEAPLVYAEESDIYAHPLCAVVHPDQLDALGKAIDDGKRWVIDIWKNLGGIPVRFDDPAPFFNINTPDDLTLWLAEKAGKKIR